MNQTGTPEYSARGVAIGLFIGFFVPMGVQLIIAIVMAYLLKANKVLSAVFTFVSNPYTVTVIYPFQCWFGSVLLGNPISYATITGAFGEFFKSPSLRALLVLGRMMERELLVPFFLAGALFGVVSAVIGYVVTIWLITRYRSRKER